VTRRRSGCTAASAARSSSRHGRVYRPRHSPRPVSPSPRARRTSRAESSRREECLGVKHAPKSAAAEHDPQHHMWALTAPPPTPAISDAFVTSSSTPRRQWAAATRPTRPGAGATHRAKVDERAVRRRSRRAQGAPRRVGRPAVAANSSFWGITLATRITEFNLSDIVIRCTRSGPPLMP
jgi:hypothetical protein